MTAAVGAFRSPLRRRRRDAVALPPLSPRLELARAALVVVFILAVSLLLELVLVSSLQQRSAQQRAFDRFRAELAQGTAPVGPTDSQGRPLGVGAPVAYLEIPAIGLRQVVVEGTTAGALFTGPGHRRDSPLPGQSGVSVIGGRRAGFGGSFARVRELDRGALIRAITGQGVFEYRVTGIRREGDPVPPRPASGQGRLVLTTADGRAFFPDGVLRVDAVMADSASPGPRRLLTSATLPPAEQWMATDSSALWPLVLWLQALIATVVGFVWGWHRLGRARAWAAFLPALLLIGLSASAEAARLLPNLL